MTGQMTPEQARVATIRALAPQSFNTEALTRELIDSGATVKAARARFLKEIAKRKIQRLSPQELGEAMGFESAGMDARPGVPDTDSVIARMHDDDFKSAIGT